MPQAFLAHQRDQRACSRITSIWCSRGGFIECNSAGMVAAMSSRFLPDEVLRLFIRVDRLRPLPHC